MQGFIAQFPRARKTAKEWNIANPHGSLILFSLAKTSSKATMLKVSQHTAKRD